MNMKPLALALAGALAAPAALANIAPLTVPGVQMIVMSSSSDHDGFIDGMVKGMLGSATIKTYRDNAHATLAFRHRAWYGLAASGIPGVTAGTPILFVQNAKGGSGIGSVARAERRESLDFSRCLVGGTVAADGGKTYDYFCPTKGLDPDSPNFANPVLNQGYLSHFGVSSMSPALFKGPYNVEFGQTQLSPAELSKLTIKPANTAIMGIVATNEVPLSTVITPADYGNMLMGNIQDWTQIYDKNYDGVNDFDDSAVSGNTNVVVCRRVNGSGIQAAYNWFFNNFPCASAFSGSTAPASMGVNGSGGDNASGIVSGSGTQANPFIIDPFGDTGGGYGVVYVVVNNSTSGDVRNCLKNAQNHTDHLIQGDDGYWYVTKFSNSDNPFKAIGILSGDSYGSENGWTFRNLDGAGSFAPATQTGSVDATGIAPSKANLLSGAWAFAVELSMYYPNATVTNPQGDVIAPLAGTKKAFVDELIKRSGNPAWIAANSKKNVYAALPDFYDAFANATNGAHVALGSHQGNMCRPLMRKF